MIRRRKIIALASLVALSYALCGYSVRCNKEQSECEVDTKRLTEGDHIAITDSAGNLVALGTVTGIKGRKRSVRIDKKYSSILRNHDLNLITDEQYNDPKDFKTAAAIADTVIAGSLGLLAVGVGEGLLGIDLEAYYEVRWKHEIRVFGRGFFVHATGDATINEEEFASYAVSVDAMGALAGASYLLMPRDNISLRAEIGLGLAFVTAKTDSQASFKEMVNNRMEPGLGLALHTEVAALFRAGDMRPYIAGSIFFLHRSLNTGIAAGLILPL